jgi:methionyl-tRNA formyltransferase
MRIVFIGTVKFSHKALQKLIDIKTNIVGVCTKKQSTFNSDFSDLTPTCIQNGIPFKFVDDINSTENVEWIRLLKPDIIFCFGWSNIIKYELLNLSPMGVLGYHPTKLPLNRGRHPLIWSLVLGLKKSASTFFFMKEGVDNGDILSQQGFEILENDDAQSLYEKITEIALFQIENFIPKLLSNTYIKRKQNHKKANFWRKRTKADGKIDFRMSGQSICNLVRALTKPYLGAHIEYKNKNFKVWKVKFIANNEINIESGKILDTNQNTFLIKISDGAIKVLEHEFEELPNIGEYL